MKRTKMALLAVCLSFSLMACSGIRDAVTGTRDYDMDKVSENVIEANNQFALSILKELNNEDPGGSIFISPLSISTALTMTYNGAEKSTREAMAKTLGYGDIERDTVNESYRNLLNYLENVDKKVELNIANSIWIREGQDIQEDFLSTNRENFNAAVDILDFSKESSVDTINGWISNATKGKIDKMLKPPISPNIVMYLINAIYFKGQWTTPFKSENTFDKTFKTLDGRDQTVKMMSRTGMVEYAEGEDYKAVRLPYGEGKTSMYCILPKEGLDLNDFIMSMDAENWNEIRESVTPTEDVVLQIPKFKLEYGIKSLNDSLQALGMGEAFGDQADFSGIREGIAISEVLHKAVIEVSEEGSEAAAVTVVAMDESAALEPITFIADRPFIFVVSDDTTGTMLFMGKLVSIK